MVAWNRNYDIIRYTSVRKYFPVSFDYYTITYEQQEMYAVKCEETEQANLVVE